VAEKGIRRAAVAVQNRRLGEIVAGVVAGGGVATIAGALRDGSAGASPSPAPSQSSPSPTSPSSPSTFHAHFDVDAGITDVAIAIAESGTLVHAVGRERGRAPTGVPPLHVVLLPASAIVPDLLDYFATLRGIPGRDLPSSVLLISGPSKTADIEGVLVTGIHGPNEVIVLLIEDA
jgi:L-lactate utilization protein LutC